MSNKARKLNIRHTYFKQRLNKAHIRPKKAHQQSSWTSSRGHPRNGNRRRPRPRDATPERVAARRAPPLHPPFGGEEAGGAKEGGYGGLRGLGPPWDKKVGFEALARGFACCLHITSKGEPPAYCLSLCRRSSGHGMLHISHMQRQRVLAQRSYVPLMRGPSQRLVEHAVRVCVYRHVDR